MMQIVRRLLCRSPESRLRLSNTTMYITFVFLSKLWLHWAQIAKLFYLFSTTQSFHFVCDIHTRNIYTLFVGMVEKSHCVMSSRLSEFILISPSQFATSCHPQQLFLSAETKIVCWVLTGNCFPNNAFYTELQSLMFCGENWFYVILTGVVISESM